jgi:probable rRNA maturation factor
MPSTDGSTVLLVRKAPDLRPLALTRFARQLEREVAKGRPFDCLIAGDAELRKLNREFRGKDETTDVLSFPEWGRFPMKHGRPRLGDVAISAARARAQARRFGHTAEQEVRLLMLHGVLHLTGMDHESDSGRMARAEKRWRSRLKLPGGLIERARG